MHLREALRNGEPLVGTFVMLPRIEVLEMLGIAGFDVAIIDLEHGPTTVAELPHLAAAAQGAGMFAVARVGDGAETTIASVLDGGVDGVLVPHVVDEQEAIRVVRAGRYPPAGERSLNPYVRGTRYGADGDAMREDANGRVALMVMIEGIDGLENVDAICGVPDLDAVFVGPVDLSASLGVPGEPEHPLVIEALMGLFERIRAGGSAGGIYAPTPEAAVRWLGAGASLVALSADSALALRAFTAAREEVASAAAARAASIQAAAASGQTSA